MITANFEAYASYVTDSLTQWDLNQVLRVSGLGLAVVPEVHFSNANTDRAIVRQATMDATGVVSVGVPNSLLQEPLRIYAHIGIYDGDTFKTVELVEIPVNPRKRPQDYQIQDSDEEIYSFNRLENEFSNFNAHIVNDANPHGVTAAQVGAVALKDRPHGHYTGNGSAERRTVNIGGDGALLVITSDVGTALVASRGAICHNRTGTAVTGVVSWEVDFTRGVLTITTTNDLLNKSGQEYYYQVV